MSTAHKHRLELDESARPHKRLCLQEKKHQDYDIQPYTYNREILQQMVLPKDKREAISLLLRVIFGDVSMIVFDYFKNWDYGLSSLIPCFPPSRFWCAVHSDTLFRDQDCQIANLKPDGVKKVSLCNETLQKEDAEVLNQLKELQMITMEECRLTKEFCQVFRWPLYVHFYGVCGWESFDADNYKDQHAILQRYSSRLLLHNVRFLSVNHCWIPLEVPDAWCVDIRNAYVVAPSAHTLIYQKTNMTDWIPFDDAFPFVEHIVYTGSLENLPSKRHWTSFQWFSDIYYDVVSTDCSQAHKDVDLLCEISDSFVVKLQDLVFDDHNNVEKFCAPFWQNPKCTMIVDETLKLAFSYQCKILKIPNLHSCAHCYSPLLNDICCPPEKRLVPLLP
jgi:hypothetical protein